MASQSTSAAKQSVDSGQEGVKPFLAHFLSKPDLPSDVKTDVSAVAPRGQ